MLNEARAKLAAVVEKLEKLEEALKNAVNEKKSLIATKSSSARFG